jgi:DNA-binding transcriptional MerR regulator
MSVHSNNRLLPIGEFAAATQLTAKALRLYDEQALLRPAVTDASSGYRYYYTHQVAEGRLIRSLRDMSLSLAEVAQVLEAESGMRALLLREFLLEAELRLARERTAYQSALLMMNGRVVTPSEPIEDIALMAQRVSIWEFTADRQSFNERYLVAQAAALRKLSAVGLEISAAVSCILLEPLTDEETRLELRIPIAFAESQNPSEVTTRYVPARRCAIVNTSGASTRDGFAASIDAIFDWFDRRAVHAFGHPEILLADSDQRANTTVRWAFVSGEHPGSEKWA